MNLLLVLALQAQANDDGKTGNSTTGCSCHGSTSSSSTTASFSASASTVAPGDVVNVSFIVSTTSSSRTHAGLDVSTTGGTLGAGSNNQRRSSEITHTRPEALSSSSITFDFTWTAPSTEGSYSLRGVGQAVNNDGRDGGDAWNNATNLTIIVDDGCDDLDGDGHETCDDGSGTDCDDSNADIHPGAAEYCDGTDYDCDGNVLEADSVDAPGWFVDADGDGFGDSAGRTEACEQPTGYTDDDTDCDDSDPLTYPYALYTCSEGGDCGFVASEYATDASTWYRDADGDGYGVSTTTATSCTQPSGYVAISADLDCDDTIASVAPGVDEYCNGRDDNCDGETDENPVDPGTFYLDADADGYGDEANAIASCALPTGYATASGDCDDTNAAFYPSAPEDCSVLVDYNCDGALADEDADEDGYIACEDCSDTDATRFPGATELCNRVDDNCDGAVDENTAADATWWYLDADSDRYGDPAVSTLACDQPSGYLSNADDCDDADPNSNPSAPEICDGGDDNCDGAIDNDAVDFLSFYADIDGDGYGDAGVVVGSCAAPTGYVADASDCNDADAGISPLGSELCNEADDDCDGNIDEGASDASIWYADADGDTYGDPRSSTESCAAPAGSVGNASDCDDTDETVNPDGTEIWYDGTDDNCDGNDADQDLDGFPSPADCADDNPEINPSAADTWYDGVDSDCDGGSDFDADGDGFDSETYGGSDCDDADPNTYAGAPEIDDGVENDCDLRNDHDRDDDGYDGEAWGGDDCDDANAEVNPGAFDEWYDGLDADCDGSDDYDQDHDGVGVDSDCDDLDPEVSTCDSAEVPNDRDRPAKDEDQNGCWGSFAGVALPLMLLASLRRRRAR